MQISHFNSKHLRPILYVFIFIVPFMACQYINNPPVIEKISANPDRLKPYDQATLTCRASDADDDKLSYAWSTANGDFIGSSKKDSVIWQAPNIPGRYALKITVSDAYDSDVDSVIIIVSDAFNFISIPSGYVSYGEGDTAMVINYGFDIMKYEVTNAQYAKYLEEALSVGEISVSSDVVSGSYPGDSQYEASDYTFLDMQTTDCKINYVTNGFVIDAGYENHPVVMVTWFGAYAFAAHYGLALPNEYEWEMAARHDKGYDYPWGNQNPDCDLANYYGCLDQTQPVGISTGTSQFGVYDMAGNVWEWTNSWYATESSNRVRRGGSFNNYGDHLKSWYRYYSDPTGTYTAVGFRCIRTY